MFHQRRSKLYLLYVLVTALFFGSCTVVKNYPKNKPFVYSNTVNVAGLISKDEKKRLQSELQNYWHDSLKVRTITQFGVRTVIKNPNAFDSSFISPSIVFMRSYLNSQGYYNAVFDDSIHTDSVKQQVRKTVIMNVELGRSLHIDSFAFDFSHPDLQRIAMENKSQSLLNSNKPFTKQLISSELDRLLILFKNNGFYKLNRENLYAEVDTTDLSLLEITFDPFEQARRISEAATRRVNNPTVDILIRERRSIGDTGTFAKYLVGNIYYYPEAPVNVSPEALINLQYKHEDTQREMTSRYNNGYIHFRPLREHTYLKRGLVYNEANYFKTVNAFTQLGAWSQADVRTFERRDTTYLKDSAASGNALQTDSLKLRHPVRFLDFHFFLTPAKKYSFSTDLEVSRNSSSIITGNLLGIANNLTLRNRNVWKESIQSSTTIRNGIELGFVDTLLQTFQSGVSQIYSIPRFITPFRITGVKKLDAYKTLISLNASYTERRNYFRLRSLVASWGYDWKKKNNLWLYRPLNIELYSLDTLPGLVDAFNKNPFLRTAFNTGYVISQNLTYSKTFPGRLPNVDNFIRISGEEAGALLGRFKSLRDKIYQYVKLEAEFRKIFKFSKTEFAYRLFGGIGYNYSNDPVIGRSLPFFKQFVAGGPNSMRAWQIRQLGLGSSLLSDTSGSFRDRFGDIQLETNLEYRFPLTVIGGVKVGSALFTDLGNIWNLKSNIENPNSKLTWNRFFKDIAIGAGTGLRFDFNYFLIRADFAYKVKDPARLKNNGWMSIKDFEWRNREYEIYSGDRLIRRNNYAIQIGIGLPF